MSGNLPEWDLRLIEEVRAAHEQAEVAQAELEQANRRQWAVLQRLLDKASRDSENTAAEEPQREQTVEYEPGPATFPVPSPELTLAILDVTREDLARDGGSDPEVVLAELSAELREELLGTIAQFALAALDRGEERADLCHGEKLDADFANDLMRSLPIDPYAAPVVLNQLQIELLAAAREKTLSAGWGHLDVASDGNIVLLLNQSAGYPFAVGETAV